MDWIGTIIKVVNKAMDGFNNATSLDSTRASSTSSSASSITPEVEEEKHEEILPMGVEESECIHEEEFCRGSESCESVPECIPSTCNGECQSMGWCDLATEFRNAIIPPIKNKKHPIGCQCRICISKLVL